MRRVGIWGYKDKKDRLCDFREYGELKMSNVSSAWCTIDEGILFRFSFASREHKKIVWSGG